MSAQQAQPLMHGIVKQVISGDSVIIRSHSRGGPPKERTLGLANIAAPKLARRPGTNQEQESKDEEYAWEAREFLRKKLVGKEVAFSIEKSPAGGREYGIIYCGKDATAENVTESLVSEGLVDVRPVGNKSSEFHLKLNELFEHAKAEKKGKFSSDASQHVRDVKWIVENPQTFMDSFHREPIKAIVEHVRDGSNMRLVLLPDFYYITMMISGIRCPVIKQEPDKSDPYAEEAKFFTECRILQRDVEVILESTSNQNFLGSILHPNGDIAVLLLKEGFAHCVDWSIMCATGGPEKLRAAERAAKEKRLRIWKNYSPSGILIDAKEKEFQAKVVEINGADSLLLKLIDGSLKKIFLSSIRPPRLTDDKADSNKNNGKIRPLYDIPHMFDAREFLRKKLIGKKVTVSIDYKQPASGAFPEKTCCTVTVGGVNVAEALVSKGLATVLRHKAEDDQRSSHYDDLLSAETKATKSGKGLHSKKETPPRRVIDLSGDLQKCKQFLSFFQRPGRMEAIVEFVPSGSRLRLYVPRENCLLTFLLGGITCPRAKRTDPKNNIVTPAEPWGDEALVYTKDLCMQREVEIEVESMDKAGNFIGWLWLDNVNLSISLVQEGFAMVHFSAERSPHYQKLKEAEAAAKSKKIKVWESHVTVEVDRKEEIERVVNPQKYTVTYVGPGLSFFAQNHEDGPKLEQLMTQLRLEFSNSLPLPGAYSPKRNELCAALFSEDRQWYRAKVEKVEKDCATIFYVDYGNRELLPVTSLASLPAAYHSLPHCAQEFTLAFVKTPKDREAEEEAEKAMKYAIINLPHMLNKEYKIGSIQYASLKTENGVTDIAKELIENGYLIVDERKEKRFETIVQDYLTAQDKAKKDRVNLWCYGDITEDDAKEFG